MTRLNCAMWRYGEGKRKEREGSQVQHSGGPKVQKEWITRMVGLLREEQPRPLGWRVQASGDNASHEGPETGRN